MEKKITKKTMEYESTVYVAMDGTEFQSENDCIAYERELQEKNLLESLNYIKAADGCPPCDGNENMEYWNYKWFKVESQEDVEKLEEVYGTNVAQPMDFPEYINIQQPEYDNDVWSVTLSECKSYVELLFSKFGIKVTFTEETEE